MKTKYAQYQIKIRLLKGKLTRLESRYPDFDFQKAIKFQKKTEKYKDTSKDLIYYSVNAEYCKDKSFRKRCENCECWKITKANWTT